MPELIDLTIPIRNEAGHISKTLESIHAQELDGRYHFNVTVIPNACTDTTAEVARLTIERLERTKKRPELRYAVVEREQPGKNATINAALAASKTELFMFVDGDVTLSANCFTALADALHTDGTVLAGATYYERVAEGTEPLAATFSKIHELLRNYPKVYGRNRKSVDAMIAFRRTLLDELPIEALGENMYINLLAAYKFGTSACQVVPSASIHQIAPQTVHDYIARDKRMQAAYQEVLVLRPDFKRAYDELFGPRMANQREVDEYLRPQLQKAGISEDDLEKWYSAQAEIMKTADLNAFLRPDGTWVPIESTKQYTTPDYELSA